MMRVLLFPADRLNYDVAPIEREDYSVTFGSLANSQCPPFPQFDMVILPFGACLTDNRANAFTAELLKRRRETATLLERSGSVMCFLFQVKDVGADAAYRPSIIEAADVDIAVRVLREAGVTLERTAQPVNVDSAVSPSFKQFFQRYGVAQCHFESQAATVLAKVAGGINAAVALESRMFAISCHFTESDRPRVEDFVTTLVEAIINFRLHANNELPAWASQYVLGADAALADSKEVLIAELAAVRAEQDRLNRFKAVLVHGDEALVETLQFVFEQGFSGQTERMEEYREDLWLLDGARTRRIMVEVKGVVGNVTRAHISQTNHNRDRNGLSDGFPALIVANTMRRADSIEGKTQDIHPEIESYAKKLNVRIMRTVDLLDELNEHLHATRPWNDWVGRWAQAEGWIRRSR